MKLYGLSDLHLRHKENRDALEQLPAHPRDWLAMAGDLGESEDHLRFGLDVLARRFARVLWTPGNHDLWTLRGASGGAGLKGEEKYHWMVEVCREYGVLTPEDPFPLWKGAGGERIIAPIFLLYDYSFRPDDVPEDGVLAWAAEHNILCADEALLSSHPYPSRQAWCAERCRVTEQRLAEAAERAPLVLITHYPLRYDLVRLRRIPRFSPWCGTRKTEDWHTRFRVEAVVYGHLHVRGSHHRDGVRFEEVSLGYPRDWDPNLGVASYLRRILPGPSA